MQPCRSQFWTSVAGVPQGSVLSLLLFSVYIGDLEQALLLFRGISFPDYSLASLLDADDLAIVAESAIALQAALDTVTAWAGSQRMSFGTGPCKIAVMRFPRWPNGGVSPFALSGRPLPWVAEYRYLCVLLDSCLTLLLHVEDSCDSERNALFAYCGWALRERLPVCAMLSLLER